MENLHIFKGSFIDTPQKDTFRVRGNCYLVAADGMVEGIYSALPGKYGSAAVTDLGGDVMIPSFIDLHIHAPQDLQTGLGMDLDLIDWLNTYTFPMEARYSDPGYARKMHPLFAGELLSNGTLRSVILGTVHNESNDILIGALKENGLSAYVGKMNMDRNAPPGLSQTTAESLNETKAFCQKHKDDALIRPIVTPRFVPSCSSELMKGLSDIAAEYGLPVQSHLSENKREIAWVKKLYPESRNYCSVYDEHGLFGRTKTLMAHGIHLSEDETEMCAAKDVRLVHCPAANLNLTSGIMPVTRYLDSGLDIGLGSDVGAGHTAAMNKIIVQAVQSSKILSLYSPGSRVLSLSEAFFLATKANGEFWGKTGCFEPGYSFDALTVRDEHGLLGELEPLNILERFLYRGDDRWITKRYLEGKKL